MKSTVLTLASLFFFGFLAAGCSTVSRLNTEYEEEMTRVEKMSPEEKAEFERNQPFPYDWSYIDADTGD